MINLSCVLLRAIQILFLISPFTSGPIIISYAAKFTKKRAIVISIRECIFSMITAAIFANGGASAVALVGITLPALKFTGGILLLKTGLTMLGFLEAPKESDQESNDEPFIVPLSFPLLAGPGTLFTIASLPAEESVETTLAAMLAVLASMAVLLLYVYNAEIFSKRGIFIIERAVGLFVSSLGSQMFLAGFWGMQ